MKWLLWREYRLNRLILVTGAVLLLLPHLFALIVLWWAPTTRSRFDLFEGAALYSVILVQLTAALLGGNAIAGERADRSAEFVAYLPVSRRRRLVSKLGLTVATMVMIWGTSLLILWILRSVNPYSTSPLRNSRPMELGFVAVTGLVFFGVGWFISSFQSSPTFAVCGGLIAPLLLVMGLQGAAWSSNVRSVDWFVTNGYAFTCPVLALTCFSIGTWYYLHRVEP